MMNACLKIMGWGDSTPRITIDGNLLEQGEDYRLGHIRTLEGTDLLLWLPGESRAPVRISLSHGAD